MTSDSLKQSHKTFSYEALPGYFVQFEPDADPAVIGSNPAAFGLKNRTSETCWTNFKSNIADLQREAPPGVKYAVNKDNIGFKTYGKKSWDEHWSLVETDGVIRWGPDAELTELGKEQARQAGNVWNTELNREDPVPMPTKFFCSPLTRAAQTLDITFSAIPNADSVHPHIMEYLREMNGVLTCNKRRSKSFIQETHPRYNIEPRFTEEDETWSPTTRESDEDMKPRLKRALNTTFGSLLEQDDTYFSITAHIATIANLLRVLGHKEYPLPTGDVIPVVIRATPRSTPL